MKTVLSEVDLRAASGGSEAPMRSSVSFAPDDGALVIATGLRKQTPTTAAAA